MAASIAIVPSSAEAVRTLKISRASAGFVQRGHPWIRPDRFTIGLEALSAGEQITLIDEQGKRLASALADPENDICARVYDQRADQPLRVDEAIDRAWKIRAAVHQDPLTNAYRIVHGEADGLPGLRVERYADVVVVVVFAACAEPLVEPVCAAIARLIPAARILVREHREDLRREAVSSRGWKNQAIKPDDIIEVTELGVRYQVQPFGGFATGLYVDQRATRSWLRSRTAGKSILNLFAYTGAFSICLLKSGAARAVDVDVSAPALRIASANAALNGVGDRHLAVRSDCLAYLTGGDERFDLIVIDPPTAAQGAGGWVARRDYAKLLRAAANRLAANGLLVACLNTLGGKPFDLERAVREAGRFQSVEPPDLGEDIPQRRGFPEGRPYRLIAAQALTS